MAAATGCEVKAVTKNIDKEALKRLRKEREALIARAKRTIKAQRKRIDAIKARLAEGPQTVPEIAASLTMDTADVMMTVAALRKYGQVVEGAKDGDYFKYQLADQAAG
jgi:DNA-directed RNA polymerase specialized sigma subunit